MKKSLKVGVAVVALLAISGTLLAQSYGTSTIQKMKEGVKNFTLSWDLNNGQSGLQSAPLTGKRTGDMLTAQEYNRMLELISEGGSTTVTGGTGGNFTTTLFRDITSGGSVKSYTCPAGQFVLSATSILGASGQNSCIIGFSSDKRSVNYGGCNVVSGQSWYTDVVCGGGSGGTGGSSVASNDFEGTTIFRDYKAGAATETHDLTTYISQGAKKIAINGHCFGGPATASYVSYEFLDAQNRGLYVFGGTTSAPITVCASGTTQTGVDASIFSEIPTRASKLVVTRTYSGPAPLQQPTSTLLILK